MNLLHLVHRVSEETLTVLDLAHLLVDGIDQDSETPIDEWDVSGTMQFRSQEFTAGEDEIVANVMFIVNEFGFQVHARTIEGNIATWTATMTLEGIHDEEQDVANSDAGDVDEYDDDPRCVCGVYLSEHSAMGCPDGFQTPRQWERTKAEIGRRVHEEYWESLDFDE